MLTVAITTHGAYDKYLPRAVESAKEFGDEVIVYDDGGECTRPKGVQYVALPKTGYVTAARKLAIEEARGDYLLHLDADDWLIARPNPRFDWFYSDLYVCDPSDAIRGVADYSTFPNDPEPAMAFLREKRTLPVPMKAVFRTAWLRENGLGWYEWPSTTFAEDARTCIEYLKHSPQILYEPRNPFYVYREHSEQDTKNDARRSLFLADLDEYLKGDE